MAHVVAGRPLAVISVALAMAWVACVGDDPGPVSSTPSADGGAAVGDRLGPCFPDGKCKEGLVCRDGAVCLTPDEPRPVDDAASGVADASEAGDAASDSVAGDAGPSWTCDHISDCPGALCCVVVDDTNHATSYCAASCQGVRRLCATNAECVTSCQKTDLTTIGGDAVSVFLCAVTP